MSARIRGYVLARADTDIVAEGQVGPATSFGTPEAARAQRDVVNHQHPGHAVVLELREID